VSVVVQDRNGRPVPGLTAADFRIRENGKEQQIALFSVESLTPGAPEEALPAGTFTNRVQGSAAAGVTVIVLDRVNTTDIHQAQAREHIITFLGQLRPEDRVAFYVIQGNAVHVLHDFTRDASSLLAALHRYSGREDGALAGSEHKAPKFEPVGIDAVDQQMAAFLTRSELAVQGFFLQKRGEMTGEALEAIAARLAGVPGRKNLIWISSGFPLRFDDGISVQTMSPQVRRAARALSDSDVAVYPVDARGLIGAFATPGSAQYQQFTSLDGVMKMLDAPQTIAAQTGGRAFFNTNDLGNAIARARDDTRLTYVLGYHPADEKWDGRFRQIKVRVRRDGVTVRHREGYYAFPRTATTPERTREALLDALHSPLDATALAMTVSIRQGAAADERTVTIHLHPGSLAISQSGDRWDAQVEVAIAQVLPDGRLFSSLDKTVSLRLTNEQRAQFMRDGVSLNHAITLRGDASQLRAAARDAIGGTVGTVTVPAASLR
jgi:VWFA-related protein